MEIDLQAIGYQLDLICEALDEIDQNYHLSVAEFDGIDDSVIEIHKIIERLRKKNQHKEATCKLK